MDKQDRFNQIIAVLIAVVSLFAAVLAYLQSDAGGRDAQANRDSIRYALEGFGSRVSGDARVNFDYNVAYQSQYEYQILANSANNRDDAAAAARYDTLAKETSALSPMLAEPYYKEGDGGPKVSQYESDVYLVKVTQLFENFKAATAVKEAWDYKANTYIIHLTLLAVALFLFGLSVTIASKFTRWIFATSGAAFTVLAMVWAGGIFVQPVFDLRAQGNAIGSYASGVGLAHQDRYEEAIQAFDQAIKDYPRYANAWLERGYADMALSNHEAAITDFKNAIDAGDASANTAGQLAYAYHLTGQFDKAIDWDKQALTASPDELWIQYDLGVNLLAAGKADEAKAVYQKANDQASADVNKVKESGGEPPSYIWSAMEDGANSLDALMYVIESGEGNPPKDKISNPDAVYSSAEELMKQLKSLSLALEYTGKAPQAQLTAQMTPFEFAEPVKDDKGEIVDYNEPTTTFANGLDEFVVRFDYSGMKDGSEVIFKLYINGEEDPSWRLVEPWNLGESGTAEIPLSYAYSDTFTFQPGEYTVEMYVDYQLAQRGFFSIEE
ncbi:MAG: tetratricopeptide repeat protein [Anaerolineae bacterium]|nr:tetratricopeptide repeat protein [Anaerolineae bacterium]